MTSSEGPAGSGTDPGGSRPGSGSRGSSGRGLDEETAWGLVRSVVGAPADGRSRAVEGEGVRIEVGPSGEWRASDPPTEAARDLLDLYLPLAVTPDLVMGQLAQSLDGRIATETGHSHYVSGPEDILRLHRLRALVDAVVVGAGTVASDDPRLTVREVPGDDPVRVVLDPDRRLSAERRVFSDPGPRTLVLERAESGRRRRDWTRGDVESVELPSHPEEGFPPGSVVDALRARGLRRILVEGGGVTVSRFLRSGLLHRLHVTVAPLVIGSGKPSLSLPPVETVDEALRPPCRIFRLGSDVLFDLDLRKMPPIRG